MMKKTQRSEPAGGFGAGGGAEITAADARPRSLTEGDLRDRVARTGRCVERVNLIGCTERSMSHVYHPSSEPAAGTRSRRHLSLRLLAEFIRRSISHEIPPNY